MISGFKFCGKHLRLLWYFKISLYKILTWMYFIGVFQRAVSTLLDPSRLSSYAFLMRILRKMPLSLYAGYGRSQKWLYQGEKETTECLIKSPGSQVSLQTVHYFTRLCCVFCFFTEKTTGKIKFQIQKSAQWDEADNQC